MAIKLRIDDTHAQLAAKQAWVASQAPSLHHTSAFWAAGHAARHANAAQLAQLLPEVRRQTLALYAAYARAGMAHVPYAQSLNPPLWELGHVGWFQEYWIGRNQQRALGAACPPHTHGPSALPQADALYDSGTVEHASRWQLPLLPEADCQQYLAHTLAHTLQCLARAEQSDAGLYFYRLVLLHEAMHAEAAVYMAQELGVSISLDLIATYDHMTMTSTKISIKKQIYTLGAGTGAGAGALDGAAAATQTKGFVFDNELQAKQVHLDAFEIDAAPVSWAQYLPFIEATGRPLPRYVRRAEHSGGLAVAQAYETQVFGHWQPLNPQAPAVHISLQEASDWCAWAGRRLPTEAEWECAATGQTSSARPAQFSWGQVWEWTCSPFVPYEGFTPHPYADYSAPWFHTRQVLRGACPATLAIMRHPRYRNYFTPDRTDIYAGFRSCAV